jgi:hypothetical protein
LRYASIGDESPEAEAFGAALHRYCVRGGKIFRTAGKVCDIALLGYVAPEKDFKFLVKQFHNAIHQYKRKMGRPFPRWSDIREVLLGLGWQAPEALCVPRSTFQERLEVFLASAEKKPAALARLIFQDLAAEPEIRDDVWLLASRAVRRQMLRDVTHGIFQPREA